MRYHAYHLALCAVPALAFRDGVVVEMEEREEREKRERE